MKKFALLATIVCLGFTGCDKPSAPPTGTAASGKGSSSASSAAKTTPPVTAPTGAPTGK